MKLPNLNPDLVDYELFPRVALLNAPTGFTLRGLGMEAALTPGKTYLLRMIPQEENNSSELLTFSDWTRYGGVEAAADADGFLRFSYTFTREQIYTLRLGEETDDGPKAVADLRVFCAGEDLYRRTPMRGNTHCHVCTSVDGSEDPFLAAAMYRRAGFDYLAITDHHLIDGSRLAMEAAKTVPNDMLLLYGEEVHVPNAYIHAVNVGALSPDGAGFDKYYHDHEAAVNAEVEAIAEANQDRLPEGVPAMDYAWRRWIADRIHAGGGAAILAHPFWEWDAHNTRDDVFRFLAQEKRYDAAEILHGQEPGCRDANMQVAFWNDMRLHRQRHPVLQVGGCRRPAVQVDRQLVGNGGIYGGRLRPRQREPARARAVDHAQRKRLRLACHVRFRVALRGGGFVGFRAVPAGGADQRKGRDQQDRQQFFHIDPSFPWFRSIYMMPIRQKMLRRAKNF